MANYDGSVDVLFSYDTDIEFLNGSLQLTNGIDHIKRKLFKLLYTVPGDWKLYRNTGSKPTEFIGEPNNRETGLNLQRFIYRHLKEGLAPIDVRVKVVPVSRESVKIYIELILLDKIIDTLPFNMDFINGITYTSFDDKVDTIKSSSIKVDDESLFNPNPIRDRLTRRNI